MKTIEQQINEANERQAIHELEYHFADALDTKNWDLAISLFGDTVLTDFSAYGIPSKAMEKSELVALYQYSFRNEKLVTGHHYTNFLITVDGDKASCRFNFTGNHFIKGLESGEYYYLHGQYYDKLKKTDSSWKIVERSLKIFFSSGNGSMLG